MPFDQLLEQVNAYYSEKVKQHGPVAQGADWKSLDSQMLRFEQLCKVVDPAEPFSILDYGCGYGALIEYLRERCLTFEYRGFDISNEMLSQARHIYGDSPRYHFFRDEAALEPADYTVASGIFNVRQQVGLEEWTEYVLYSLARINALSLKGFAFNALTSYSDADRKRPDLYYADPLFFFDYCKRNFSKYVALIHDYPLWEFTLIVKR